MYVRLHLCGRVCVSVLCLILPLCVLVYTRAVSRLLSSNITRSRQNVNLLPLHSRKEMLTPSPSLPINAQNKHTHLTFHNTPNPYLSGRLTPLPNTSRDTPHTQQFSLTLRVIDMTTTAVLQPESLTRYCRTLSNYRTGRLSDDHTGAARSC